MDVILLSDDGQIIGRAPKAEVHGTATPLHLAFSCHLFDAAGRVLITRRALQKRTWPGVWTNSFCGHPQPGEAPADAVRRHARHELGVEIDALQVELPTFRYQAVDASGVMENELCPVYTAGAAGEIIANPAEVMDLAWVRPADLARAVAATPFVFSPWLVLQVAELSAYAAPTDRSVGVREHGTHEHSTHEHSTHEHSTHEHSTLEHGAHTVGAAR